jgi:hexosaminidase
MDNLGDEGYSLQVTPASITIAAPQQAGIFYGIQTLRQLFPPQVFSDTPVEGVRWMIPCVRIKDYPQFRWRGMHLDVARHFMPKEFVLKFIDLVALHKMNSLHLHLTDDQGWRIEIKRYPRLTEVGAWRDETLVGHANKKPHEFDGKRHGGYYTHEDIREIVAYAAQRYINIVPEIEMPGHAQAAIAAYPELGNTGEQLPVRTFWGVNPNIFNANEETIILLQNVLTEVLDLFPSPYIHVGGDEAVKDQWKQSPEAQARIKELSLKDEDELQSYFIKRMDTFLSEHGRRLIGWDEILEGGLAPGATVMSWRGVEGGIKAAKMGHDVVMAPTTHTYFDYYQSKNRREEPLAIGGYLPLEKVYDFQPVPSELTEEEAKHILGAQGQIWTEYIPNPKHAEYMAFPRTVALCEAVWTPGEKKDYADFLRRLTVHLKRLDLLNVNYRPLDEDKG